MKNVTENNRVVSLIYHDVVEREVHHLSGFPSADAALYKLDPELFRQHIDTIARTVSGLPVLVTELAATNNALSGTPWMITFDDGGASFHTRIADLLENQGWRAHFFVATDYIGKPGFMSPEQIRDLRHRGHIIGSHSCSHPLRFASRPWNEMEREWSESTSVLSELLEEPVRIASLPGGQYSKQVAQTAAAAGIKVLFTSEPTTRTTEVEGCLVLGRYSIQRWMSPAVAAAIASGRFAPRFRQLVWWEFKKFSKTVGGNFYLRAREKWMNELNRNPVK
ncbi:MAG: polysaccharide deacetylase family protein [Acidobacteria bacterium]|nr:polysaccharide deacetylase family protein [Acidobacteriota bacterium]